MSSGTRKRDKPGQTGTKRDRLVRGRRDTGIHRWCAFSTPRPGFVPSRRFLLSRRWCLSAGTAHALGVGQMRRHVRKDGVDSSRNGHQTAKHAVCCLKPETGCTIDSRSRSRSSIRPDHRGSQTTTSARATLPTFARSWLTLREPRRRLTSHSTPTINECGAYHYGARPFQTHINARFRRAKAMV